METHESYLMCLVVCLGFVCDADRPQKRDDLGGNDVAWAILHQSSFTVIHFV